MKKLLLVVFVILVLPVSALAEEFVLPLENGVITTSFDEGGLMLKSDSNSVIATESGIVKIYNNTTVAIDHGDLRTIYYNLDEIYYSKEEEIKKGKKLGYVASGKVYVEVREYSEDIDSFMMLDATEYIVTEESKINSKEVKLETVDYTPTEQEFHFYCKVVMGEIGGFTGSSDNEDERLVRIAVAESILNRVQSKSFGNTLNKVLSQKNQYSCINEDWFDEREYTQEVIEVAKAALTGESPTYHPVVGGATSYYFPKASDSNGGSWMQRNMICTSIWGAHIFGNFKSDLQNEGFDLSDTVVDKYGNTWYDQETLDKWQDKLDEKFQA